MSAFSDVFAWSKQQFAVGEGGDMQLANGIFVSRDFFHVLGVEPWRGRLLLPEDEHACPEIAAVVSHGYWQSKMGGRAIEGDQSASLTLGAGTAVKPRGVSEGIRRTFRLCGQALLTSD